MDRLSVVINTLNEEKNLPKAIKTVKNIAGEIVVCDMYSSDKTRSIAKKLGAKVVKHKKTGYVEPARNYAISQASGNWILILDADERLTKSLRKKIKDLIQEPTADYFRIPRKNIIFDKWVKHSRWWPDYNIRFFRKGYVEWSEIIHSVPTTKGKGLDLPAKEKNAIVHYHYLTIEQYIDRLNRYSSHQAKGLIKEGYKFAWQDLITKPANEFFSRYFAGEGYKDGLHGLALSCLQTMSELAVYLKVWQAGGFTQKQLSVKSVIGQIKKTQKDANYWNAETLLNTNGGIINRLRRKFKI